MSSLGSISFWIDEVKRGDPQAIEAIWDRYFPQLVRLAREKLAGLPRPMADAEDVALSALDSFCRAAQRGSFPDLADRQGLWRLLFQLTVHKAVDVARHERRQRRGGVQLRQEAGEAGSTSSENALAQVADTDAQAPEVAAMMAEECRRLLDCLPPDLQKLALARMEGYGNEEIATQMGYSVRTVERRLYVIRRKWGQERPR
jgi:RNA polymerase sigma factor (sigma-70 family)